MSVPDGRAVTSTEQRPWTFLTNHSRVLVLIDGEREIRMRDISAAIGITERSTQRIVADLEEAGYLSHERVGRRNRYEVRPGMSLRHPREQDVEVGLLLALFGDDGGG